MFKTRSGGKVKYRFRFDLLSDSNSNWLNSRITGIIPNLHSKSLRLNVTKQKYSITRQVIGLIQRLISQI